MASRERVPWAHSPKTFLFAAGVGVIGGLIGTLFQLGTFGLQAAIIGRGGLLHAALQLPWSARLLIPFLGAIIASLLVYGLGRKHRTQGMSDVMEVVSFRTVRKLRISSTVARAASSLALIATGGSVGREGPIVYLSAAFGARLGRLTRYPESRLRLFAGCGVAAGMSAAYYAPFGAAIFALEVVLASFAIEILAPVVVASVVAALVGKALAMPGLLGSWIKGPPVYELPRFTANHPAEYLLYILLGAAAAGAAWLFVRTMRKAEGAFSRLRLPAVVKLPLGGLLLGVIGIWLPHVWGNGYDAVNLILKETPTLQFVVLLFFMKIIATSVTVGSGGSGGIFTPTLFVGAALGLVVGVGAQALFPDLVVDPRHYAVVGMVAVLSATTHAPIMAIFILFEMTRETEMILPMMLAAITATVVARAVGLESVYYEPLRRRGLQIPEGIEETALTTTRVRDIMRAEAVWTRETATFDMIVGMFQKTRKDAIYVVNEASRPLGVIQLHDIKNHLADDALGPAVIAADLTVPMPTVSPTQTLAEVLDHFDDPELHELAVVDPDHGKLVGVLDRRDLLTAISVEVLQSPQLRAKFVEPEGAQHYVEMQRGHAVSRIRVPPDMAGRTLADSDFRNRTGLTVLTIVHEENGKETRLQPAPGAVLGANDSLIVMGPVDRIRRFGGDA